MVFTTLTDVWSSTMNNSDYNWCAKPYRRNSGHIAEHLAVHGLRVSPEICLKASSKAAEVEPSAVNSPVLLAKEMAVQ